MSDKPIEVSIAAAAPDEHARIVALTHELRAKDEYLSSALEELETANEELKSSNAMLQAVNEVLESSNEELETSKEEMQALNDEWQTVNEELNTKVADQCKVNNSLLNLLAGSGIGSVFLDRSLRISHFTPASKSFINLALHDVGRKLDNFASNLAGYGDMVADVRSVLNTLVPISREVHSTDGCRYFLRILPYRTLDNKIEGVVITCVDISDLQPSAMLTA